jgi:hypothetical protein
MYRVEEYGMNLWAVVNDETGFRVGGLSQDDAFALAVELLSKAAL